MALTTSALAGSAGVSPDTVRYYERLGLLRPPRRTAAGYRLYGQDDVERLRFICGAKRMGLRLADIRELLEVSERGQCPCGHTRDLVNQRLSAIDAEIRQLAAIRGQLIGLKERSQECFDAGAADWPCAVGIANGGEI